MTCLHSPGSWLCSALALALILASRISLGEVSVMRPFYANGVIAAYWFALAARRLPHDLTKSSAPQPLASAGAGQCPRPRLPCDSKPRLDCGRILPCWATCLFNCRESLLDPKTRES